MGEQLPHFLAQRGARQVLLFQNHRRAPPHHGHGVVVLVVFRHVGRGHQDGRLPLRLQLAQGDGPGAADDEVRGGEAFRHVGDILPDVELRVRDGVDPFLLQQIGEPPAPPAIAVDVLELPGPGAFGQQVGRGLVDFARAEAPAEGQNQGALVQLQPGAGLVPPGAQHLPPDGVAGQHAARGGGKVLLRVGHGEQGAVRVSGEDSVGDAGERVLLVDHGRHPQADRLPHDGARHIAARPHADVRPERADDAAGLPAGRQHMHQCGGVFPDVFPAYFPLEAGNGDAFERESGGRDQRLFHAAPGADVQDLRVRLRLPQIAGHRQRRIDMPGGSPARKQYLHNLYRLPFKFFQWTTFGISTAGCPSPPAGRRAKCRRS